MIGEISSIRLQVLTFHSEWTHFFRIFSISCCGSDSMSKNKRSTVSIFILFIHKCTESHTDTYTSLIFFMRFYFMSIHFISFFSSLHIDAYAVPANFLEIDVVNPMTTITAGKKRFTDYEVRMRVSVMIMCFIWRIPIDTGAGIFILSFMKCDDEFLSFPKKWAILLHAFYVCVSMGLAIIRSIH